MSDTDAVTGPQTARSDRHFGDSGRVGAIVVASSGNLVEWFDFYIYAFCSLYFAPAFFPKSDQTGQLLDAAGIFAAGFVMRPLGGWLFGRLADRAGRRSALIGSVLIMCVGSLSIALIPTYAQIGPLAPILLLAARLVQGLSVGGEYGTAATYMSEIAVEGRRGFLSSFQYVTLIGGQLAASLVLLALQHAISLEGLKAWGWRIPFAVGAVAALVALALRLRLHETADTATRRQKTAGSLRTLLRRHTGAFITVLGYTAGGSLLFYTFTTYMQKYLVNTVGVPIATANTIMTGSLFVFMCVQPAFGALSDRIGRRASMIVFGVLGTLCPLPLMLGLRTVHDPWILFALVTLALGVLSFYTSISGIVKAEMFPTEVRALGVGLAYAISNSLFGGSAEYVALAFKSNGHEDIFYGYVTLMMAAVFLISLRLPARTSYLNDRPADQALPKS